MNHQNEMEIAEKYSNLPYTLKKLQDFTFSEVKFLVGGGGPDPPPPLQALGNLLYYWDRSKSQIILVKYQSDFRICYFSLGTCGPIFHV